MCSREEQPLPPIDSPTAESPGYVVESDPEEDPKEYEDDETEDGPVDYPMDGGDDGDDDDGDYLGMSRSRITVWLQASISLPPEAEVERLLAMTTPSPSPPISLSPSSEGRYEIGESSTARPIGGRGIDYGFVSTVDAEARGQGISEVGYGIRDTWVDPAEAVPEDLYALLEDAQDGRTRISQRVAIDSQRVDLLMGDRMTLQETVWIVEEEAYTSREAWAHYRIESGTLRASDPP
ncbi:hypothetical protein Tco_1329854 [Tanacetum coccineum]